MGEVRSAAGMEAVFRTAEEATDAANFRALELLIDALAGGRPLAPAVREAAGAARATVELELLVRSAGLF